MTIVLTILSIIETALSVLKQIPATSSIANEISTLEQAFSDVLAKAQAAKTQAEQQVDPSQLNTIDPVQ